MSIVADLLSAAMYALVINNIIFTGGFGASEAVRMSAKPKQLFPLTILITFFSTFSSIICVVLDQFPRIRALNDIIHSIIFLAVIVVLYFVVLFVAVVVFKAKRRTVSKIAISAFNTLVLAVPFINSRSAFGFAEAIGIGIGSGLAFVVAVLLINFGLRRLAKNDSIPNCFRGTPALFVYVSVLALAFAGISSKGLTL